jgi:hypothetical protein
MINIVGKPFVVLPEALINLCHMILGILNLLKMGLLAGL